MLAEYSAHSCVRRPAGRRVVPLPAADTVVAVVVIVDLSVHCRALDGHHLLMPDGSALAWHSAISPGARACRGTSGSQTAPARRPA